MNQTSILPVIHAPFTFNLRLTLTEAARRTNRPDQTIITWMREHDSRLHYDGNMQMFPDSDLPILLDLNATRRRLKKHTRTAKTANEFKPMSEDFHVSLRLTDRQAGYAMACELTNAEFVVMCIERECEHIKAVLNANRR